MKNQKGITLIALIITIIVMLILVGVTINVALNGGIFDKAKTASDQTNLAKEKEILQTKALGYLNNNGYVDLAEFVDEESPLEGYTLTDNTTYVTAANGTSTFYITKQGGITDKEPQSENPNIVTHPSIAEGTVWSNVSLAQTIPAPQSNNYFAMFFGTDSIEYEPEGIITVNEEYPAIILHVGEYEYMYSWGNYTYDDGEDTFSVFAGWQDSPWAENQEAPDISTVRLSGTISYTNDSKTYNVPAECANWFIQN